GAVFRLSALPALQGEPHWPETGVREPVNGPLCVRAFLHLVEGCGGGLIDARGVGHERPDHFRRLGVVAFLAIVIEAFHRLFRGRPPLRAAAPLRYYTDEPQYGFVISGGPGFAPILPRPSLVYTQSEARSMAGGPGKGRPECSVPCLPSPLSPWPWAPPLRSRTRSPRGGR